MLKVYLVVIVIFISYLLPQVLGQPAHDKKLLSEMISFNDEMKSDRLVVSIQDTVVADVTFRGKPGEKYLLYSITKVFSAVAIGLMIDKKLIPHAEVPLAAFFESWKTDSVKSRITLRHILQHTSGIAANKGSQDIYPQADFVEFAMNSPLETEPGTTFFYNNKAFNLISGVVKKVTGVSLEVFIRDHLFNPLGITDYVWKHDDAGNTWGMDGLWLNANDLMKIGQLLSNKGIWMEKRIISENWCQLMFQVPLVNAMQGRYGYAMGIRALPFSEQMSIAAETIDKLRNLGLPADLANRLSTLQEKAPYAYLELGKQLKAIFTLQEMEAISAFASTHRIPLYTITNGNYYIMHGGEYGLLLAAFPKQRKALVRFIGEKWGRKKKADGSDNKYLIDDELMIHLLRL